MGYRFDGGQCRRAKGLLWTLVYDNRHTKAVLLKNGKVHRELDRNYYFANSFDYPITFTTFKEYLAVVHCPKSHDELQIEDAETGEILAIRKTKEMEFHSRLAMSSNERYLLSAGWFWHPLHGAWACDLVDGTEEFSYSFGAEVDSAAFLGDDLLVVTTTDELMDDQIPRNGLAPMQLGVWSLSRSRWLSTVTLSDVSGMIMPWREWIISFHGHPKAIEASTGLVARRWEDVDSGRQVGAINLGTPPPPPIALDPKGGRFAVGGPEGITIVSLSA